MSRLRIATFNVNGIRSRLPHLLQWLEREQPDIVCLQELKAADEGFPRAAIETAGYGARWQGQRSWNGVAILARDAQPIESRRGLPGDPDDSHSRYLEAVAHGVVVGCLYLPNGNPQPGPKFDYKLRWFERLIAHAHDLLRSGHPVVLAGDFNVVPTDELDIYNPRSWRRDALLQPASREAWRRLLAQGWTDALRTLYPQEQIFTFWDYFREHWPRNAGLRIDHLVLSPSLAPRLKAGGVDRWVRGLEGASDHAPTWIELDMTGSTGKPQRARGMAKKAAKRAATKAPAKPAGTPAARSPTQAAAKKAAKTTAKSPGKPAARSPIQSAAKKAAKTTAKSPGKPAARSPTQAAAKKAAKTTPEAAAKAATRRSANKATAATPKKVAKVARSAKQTKRVANRRAKKPAKPGKPATGQRRSQEVR